MKNVTITVEEGALEWARIEAAKRNTSVSRLVGELIAEKMRHNDAYDRAYQEWKADRVKIKTDGKPYPKREELYAERLDRFR
jgi:hypothetical protein